MPQWGRSRCAICDLEIETTTIEEAIAAMNLHSERVHPEVVHQSQIDEARRRWQREHKTQADLPRVE